MPDYGTTFLDCLRHSRMKKVPTKEELEKLNEDRFGFLSTMGDETDRGCLLVAISHIADLLGEMLLLILSHDNDGMDAKWMLDPKAGDRPLASLAVRTRMARCLNLITDKDRKTINAIRKLRNEHAHGTEPFRFSKQAVDAIMTAHITEGPMRPDGSFTRTARFDKSIAPRMLFMITVSTLAYRIRLKTEKLKARLNRGQSNRVVRKHSPPRPPVRLRTVSAKQLEALAAKILASRTRTDG